MTENEFAGLFGEDFNEIAETLAAAEAEETAKAAKVTEAPAKKDGLWYSHDEDDANGHAVSVYAVNAHGKTILWARVNNFLEISTASLGQVPEGISGHPITIVGTNGTAMVTAGIALKAPHQDGTGAHIDGHSVRSYVLPRLTRFIAGLYGV